ncbi:hypothetical protein LH128_01167 [Sphingomonas sp. LH128]|uniref:hypothetical protein n=1 Tax=Sphingomonas sp. LH128 TaxID=473781 RepID=UPI00027CC201|nr:hypothetical protein [Sphingomonas sp. LH128]EJU14943.1 hypothetical protein LH128_01167 [Sphingomonas sp. LH128]
MRVVLKLADPDLNENPAVREWLDKMAAVLNTPEMIEERDRQLVDLNCYGMTLTVDGKRVDPAEMFMPRPGEHVRWPPEER